MTVLHILLEGCWVERPSLRPFHLKTIEGALGGIAFGILAAYLLNIYMFQQPYPIEK